MTTPKAEEGTKGSYVLPSPPTYARERYLASDASQAFEKLKEYGIAVIPNIIPEDLIRQTKKGVFSGLEEAFPGFCRDDKSTWRLIRDHGAKHAQLIQEYGLGWMEPVVNLRQHPRIAQTFAELWSAQMQTKVGPHDLFSSADGLSVYLNTEDSRGGFNRPKTGAWLHWDRRPDDPVWSVQGFVNVYKTCEGGASFQCLTRSHGLQHAFVERFPETKDKRFHLLANQEQADFYLLRGCKHVCIAAMPADLVLWDSRLIHCGKAAEKTARRLKRMVIYVSMQPKRFASKKDVELKKRAFKQLRSTSHNAAAGVQLFTKYARVRCAKDDELKRRSRPVAVAPKLTALGRSLFGVE